MNNHDVKSERVAFSPTNSPLPSYINEIGWGRFKNARQRQPHHTHKNLFEICYVAKGLVHWRVEGTSFDIPRGHIQFVKPGVAHGGVDKMIHPSELYWIEVDLSDFKRISARMFSDLIQGLRGINHNCFQVSAKYPLLFEEIFSLCLNPTPLRHASMNSHIIELLIETVISYHAFIKNQNEKKRERARKIGVALDWIKKHIDEQFSVENVADVCSLKVSRFHELFLHETGFTPMEYVNRQRMEKAKQLLTKTQQSITDIAFTIGFNSTQYFATIFKKYSGTTPSEYRKDSVVFGKPNL